MSSSISAKLALGQFPVVKEPLLIGEWLIWLEQRPSEAGRITALLRPWGSNELTPQELTPAPINLKTKIHAYGGAAFAGAIFEDKLILSWIDGSDGGSLWTQTYKLIDHNNSHHNNWAQLISDPFCFYFSKKCLFGGGLIDVLRNRWIGIMEKDGKDFIVSFELEKPNNKPTILHTALDFSGYLALSPDFSELAWIEWQQPKMPWDSSQLWLGSFDDQGNISSKTLIAGSGIKGRNDISVFQPIWLSNDQIAVSEDSSGFWNVMTANTKFNLNSLPIWNKLWPMEADSGMPQWVHGMSTKSSSGQNIISSSCKSGSWRLEILGVNGSVDRIDQPFDDLSFIRADERRFVADASNSYIGNGLLEIDLETGQWFHTPSAKSSLTDFLISKPESFWFEGYMGRKTHAWYYPPSFGSKKKAPLLVKSHSGPTSMANKGLDLSIQFWTSRGWGVVDVNYGGSTGFGRDYRDRLKGCWGLVDAFDCKLAAEFLISIDKANHDLIAIEGSSAGGFTTLSCLCLTNIFKVAACRYGVSDLLSLANQTHRFEKGYFDYLLGNIYENEEVYKARSPLNKAHNISSPVIFFQGMQDNVVPPEQTFYIADSLREKNIPVEVHTYAEESHGFKDPVVRIDVLEKMELFFRKHLNIIPE